MFMQDNIFEWHFTIAGPQDTPFEGGRFHGRLILPTDYPMKPPNIIIMTVSARPSHCGRGAACLRRWCATRVESMAQFLMI